MTMTYQDFDENIGAIAIATKLQAEIRELRRESRNNAILLDKALADLEKATAEDAPCTWTYDAWSEHNTWETDCGQSFDIIVGIPKDNDMRFCCFCGKPLVEIVLPKDDDEEQEGEA